MPKSLPYRPLYTVKMRKAQDATYEEFDLFNLVVGICRPGLFENFEIPSESRVSTN
jgi:hypothetical protein